MSFTDKELSDCVPGLLRYARSLTRNPDKAEDLLNDTICRALKKRHLYTEDAKLKQWLGVIMHSQYVNYVRRIAREGKSVEVRDTDPALTYQADQDCGLRMRDLARAFGQLSEDQQQVIMLIGVEGKRYDTAAEIVGIPVGTIRSRLSRGRVNLKELVG
jgi:RNA polymerase sigma-70 factor (ECF subfamily)